MKKNIVLSITGDHHTNSIVGLCPPYVELEEGQYRASKAQRWLWRNWLMYIAQVKGAMAEHDADLVNVFNGDICDGDHHGTFQIVTRNVVIQQRMAYKTLSPLVEVATQNYVIKGTGAHGGRSGFRDEQFGEDIEAVKNESGGYAHWILNLNINGTRLNIRHHGTMGRLPWTRSNSLKRLAVETVFNYAERGDKPPDVIVQAHRHVYADTKDEFNNIRVIAAPGWQLATEYVHKIAPGSLGSIGGLIVVCFADGGYEVRPILFKPHREKEYRV